MCEIVTETHRIRHIRRILLQKHKLKYDFRKQLAVYVYFWLISLIKLKNSDFWGVKLYFHPFLWCEI
jgi:hypothetical protein